MSFIAPQLSSRRLPTTLYSWGVGKNGELGIDIEKNCFGKSKTNSLPTLVKKAVEPDVICCFSNYSMYIDTNNDVYGFGSNMKNRMGFKGY